MLFYKNIYLLFILFLSIPNLTSGQYFYIPDNDTNLMQLKDQNDFLLSLAFPRSQRLNVQLAYSPLKYISLSSAFYKHAHTTNNNIKTEGTSYTGSIGLYRFIHKLDKHNFFLTKNMSGVLLYANTGLTIGTNKINIVDIFFSNLKHKNIFFRSGISVDYRFVSLGFSTRYLNLDYQNVNFIGNPFEVPWFIDRLEKDVVEQDPRRLKETMFRIKFLNERFDLYADVNTIRGRKERALSSTYYIFKTYNFGIIVKLDQLLGFKK